MHTYKVYMHTYIPIHMYTGTHTYIYMHTHVYMYTYMQIYMYRGIHVFMYTYIHIHVYIYSYIHLYIYTFIPVYMYTCIHMYIYTYIHKYIFRYLQTIYIYTYIYIYIYTCISKYIYIYIYIYMIHDIPMPVACTRPVENQAGENFCFGFNKPDFQEIKRSLTRLNRRIRFVFLLHPDSFQNVNCFWFSGSRTISAVIALASAALDKDLGNCFHFRQNFVHFTIQT